MKVTFRSLIIVFNYDYAKTLILLDGGATCYAAPTVLASSVEILWVPNPQSGPLVNSRQPHLTQALWLCCGAHGTLLRLRRPEAS